MQARRFASLIIALLFLSSAWPVSAGGSAGADPVGLWDLARVIGGLLVVVLAIVATAFGLKRLKSLHAVHGSHIRIIDGMSVSTRDRIVLVEVDQQRVLLGVSPGRIQALHVFAPDADPQSSFAEMVERADVPLAGGVAR
jgi:flagellar protein FliO/FliZ